MFRNSQGRMAWGSTFDPQDCERPEFAQRVITQIGKTFESGAIVVKIYKSMGMELKSQAGKYLLPDDPSLPLATGSFLPQERQSSMPAAKFAVLNGLSRF